MDDLQLAKFIVKTLCRNVEGDPAKFEEEWRSMSEADRKPFIQSAIEIRAKILEAKNVQS